MKTRHVLVPDNAAYLSGICHLCGWSAFTRHQVVHGSADGQSWGYHPCLTEIHRAFCIDPTAKSEVNMLDLCQMPEFSADLQTILGAFHRAFV